MCFFPGPASSSGPNGRPAPIPISFVTHPIVLGGEPEIQSLREMHTMLFSTYAYAGKLEVTKLLPMFQQ